MSCASIKGLAEPYIGGCVPRQSAFGGECRSSWEICVPIRFRSANAVRPLWVFIYFIWGGGNAERGFEPGGESLQAARLHRLDHSATPHPLYHHLYHVI
jgi:hypothetical protein